MFKLFRNVALGISCVSTMASGLSAVMATSGGGPVSGAELTESRSVNLMVPWKLNYRHPKDTWVVAETATKAWVMLQMDISVHDTFEILHQRIQAVAANSNVGCDNIQNLELRWLENSRVGAAEAEAQVAVDISPYGSQAPALAPKNVKSAGLLPDVAALGSKEFVFNKIKNSIWWNNYTTFNV